MVKSMALGYSLFIIKADKYEGILTNRCSERRRKRTISELPLILFLPSFILDGRWIEGVVMKGLHIRNY
jgi:hypothetical protein